MRRLISTGLLVALCAMVLSASPVGADEAPALQSHVDAWVAATDADGRTDAALQVLLATPSASDLSSALSSALAPPKDAPTAKPVEWKYSTVAGVEHTMFALAPPSYDAAKPMPLLIWLHGGVSRDEDNGGGGSLRRMAQYAITNNVLLLAPSGRNGAVWWDEAGVTMVRAALREMGRRYNVDAKRVAIGGFSDGASGCYQLLVSDPTPYCCFFALAGQPGVARLMGGPTHIPNLPSRPVYATHGGKDQLYPTERMRPMMEVLQKAGARIEWQDFPDDEHNWAAVLPRLDEMMAFWKKSPRVTPTSIAWQTARPTLYGRFEWIEIVRVDPKATGDKTLNPSVIPLVLPKPRPRLGIRLDTKHQGPGLRIEEVQDGTAAQDAGMQAGDLLVRVDGAELATSADLIKLRDALKALADEKRDGTFVVKRGDEEIEMKLRPRPVKSDALTGHAAHKLPLGVVKAEVKAGNVIEVRTRGVSQFKVHFDPTLVDLSKPVTVLVNGVERVKRMVRADAGYMLTEAHRLGHTPTTHAVLILTP